MPNWVDCELSVCGEADAVKKFMDAVSSEKSAIDASKLIPYPEEYRKLDEVGHEWDRKWEMLRNELKDADGKLSDEKREEAWKRCIAENGERPKDGFNSGGYEWCIANWGTKWGICDVTVCDDNAECGFIEYGFQTAWSPPIPIVRKMGEMFPELTFQLRYYEGGNAFQGSLTVKGGKEVEDWSGEYIGTRGG